MQHIIFRALALAMGVAAVVISILSGATSSVESLLGIGLASLAIDSLSKKA